MKPIENPLVDIEVAYLPDLEESTESSTKKTLAHS